jgi:hypothetical protein
MASMRVTTADLADRIGQVVADSRRRQREAVGDLVGGDARFGGPEHVGFPGGQRRAAGLSAPPGMTIALQKLTAVDLSSEIEFAA